MLVPASTVTAKSIAWHWEGWIPLGYPTVLAGDGGVGKGLTAVWLTAQASHGAPLPGEESGRDPVRTLVVCDEDGQDDVIVPRLMIAGADESKVEFLVVRDRMLSLPDDVGLVEKAVKTGAFGLVWIDSASSYLGKGLSINHDQDVRRALMPVGKLAKDRQVAMLLTWHLNKSTHNAAGHRVTGSTAIRNAARSLLIAGRLPDRFGDGFGIVVEKSNYARRPPGRGYVVNGDNMVVTKDGLTDAPRLEWTEVLPDLLPDELMPRKRKGARGRPPYQLRKARVFLLDMLDAGPMPADGLLSKATEEGISERTLREAKRVLKIASKMHGGSWQWELSKETREIVRQAEEG
jgi:hypothetical protein